MTGPTLHSPPSAPIPATMVDQAIAWAVRLDFSASSPDSRAAFERWLGADPMHAVAWQRVQSLNDDFSGLPSRLALETLKTAGDRKGLGRRQALRLLSCAGLVAASGWGAREYTPWQRLLADISTGTGEQRSVRLQDGTALALNTDTAISIDLSGARREIVLRRGEILISTGADGGAKRPFWVRTPFGEMQALGTRFVVRLDRARALIGVQEGAVALHPGAAQTSTEVVTAGGNGWLSEAGSGPAPAPVFAADAWADGVISGKDVRLADLLAELARYRNGRVVCDERVADLRVSGVYQVGDTDRALHFLAQTQPLRLVWRTRFWVRVEPA